MISLSIDGKTATVEEGTTVLHAARSVGIEIPTLCYHPELKPNAACRLCTVEVTQGPGTRLLASCALPATEGMEVQTASERVLKGRRIIMELLVARCSTVEQIKALGEAIGARADRMEARKEDCILCGLCVSACTQTVGANALGVKGRGVTRAVGKTLNAEADCIACGACAYVCPTGCLKMERETLERDDGKGEPRYCRYMRMGMVPYGICPSSYMCNQCELDQRAEDTLGDHPAFTARPAKQTAEVEVDGYRVMPDFYYHAGHAWAERIGGVVRLGVDDFAQKVAGQVDEVELLKEKGAEVKAGEAIWKLTLADGKSVTMTSPVSGALLSINEGVILDPTLLRKAPYSRGWVCLVRPSTLDELAGLRFKDAAIPFYRRPGPDPVGDWVISEAEKLRQLQAENAEWQTVAQAFFGQQQ